MVKNKCIVVLCVGNFFQKHLVEVFPMLKKYSDKCNADLIVRDTPPDVHFKHNLLSQKLLIPELYKKYEHILMLDLDIFISDSCPNIFDEIIDNNIGFSAKEAQVHSNEYKYVCENVWGISSANQNQRNPYTGSIESHIKGINGGVMYVNSFMMADLFKQFYFNNSTVWSKDTVCMNNEEIPMRWIANNNNVFLPMNEKYNQLIIYYLPKDYKDVIETYKGIRGKIYRRTYKKIPKFVTNNIFGSRYKEAVSSAIDYSDGITHFAGGFPYPYFKL